jgi:very-short-patch-repair endonuclease
MTQQPELLKRASAMRCEATPFEIMLWRHLSNSQLSGFKFRRQHVIDGSIVDFFCPSKKLIIEVDGDTHDAAADERRDRKLAALGYGTLRFTNEQIAQELEGVLSTILQTLDAAPDRWPTPHPNPSPEGEGL